MHQKASAQQAKALSELDKETGMRWRALPCVMDANVICLIRPSLVCLRRNRRPARVLKEAADKEAELAEVLADIAVHETQVKEADEHNAVTARRIDDIKRELDQVRKHAGESGQGDGGSHVAPARCSIFSCYLGGGHGARARAADRDQPHQRQPVGRDAPEPAAPGRPSNARGRSPSNGWSVYQTIDRHWELDVSISYGRSSRKSRNSSSDF